MSSRDSSTDWSGSSKIRASGAGSLPVADGLAEGEPVGSLRRSTAQTPGEGWLRGRRRRRATIPGYGTRARPMLFVSVPNQIARVGA